MPLLRRSDVAPSKFASSVVWTALALVACTSRPEPTGVGAQAVLPCAQNDNPIQCENRQNGTTDWQLTQPIRDGGHSLEGYASSTSVNQHEPIDLFVNSGTGFDLEIFRMGWYDGGTGGRRVFGPQSFGPQSQKNTTIDTDSGFVECNWMKTTQILTDNFLSGFYLVKLSAPDRNSPSAQSYIIFVVREGGRDAGFLMNSAVTTYQAYNGWGGYSLYSRLPVPGNPDASTPVTKVSFDRPYEQSDQGAGQGAGRFFLAYANEYGPGKGPEVWPTFGFEYPMVRFLERNGYDVTYATDIDLHSTSAPPNGLLANRAAFLSVGHDEYWSRPMYQNLSAWRDVGKNLAFFSGNSVYWIINVLSSSNGQRANRILETNKDDEKNWRWINDTTSGSEQMLVGTQTIDGKYDRGDVVFSAADFQKPSASWMFSGTGLDAGDRLPGIIGYEGQLVCGLDAGQYPDCDDSQRRPLPLNHTTIAHSRFKAHPWDAGNPTAPEYLYADMALYQTPPQQGSAWVFSSGAPDWNFGLDVYNDFFKQTVFPVFHPAISQITKNVLAQFGGLPPPEPLPTPNGYTLTIRPPQQSYQNGTGITVDWTAPAGRPANCGQTCGDFIDLYPDGPSVHDDNLAAYTPCFTMGGTFGTCNFVLPTVPGTYAITYVTLDRTWLSNYGEPNLRTIWRGAKAIIVVK